MLEPTRVHELLDRFNAGDPDAVAELVAPSWFSHVPEPGEPSATEVNARLLADLRGAMPDLRIEIPDLAVGDDGNLHGTAMVSGTQTGSLWGVPPLGRAHRFEIPVTLREVDGRFALRIDAPPPVMIGHLRAMEVVPPPDAMHLPNPHPVSLPDVVARFAFTGRAGDKPCSHLGEVRATRTDKATCDGCAPDEIWPALRLCLVCGHVGCCDTSTNKHAKAHWQATGHTLIRSLNRDERWTWCYADDAIFEGRTLDAIEGRLGGVR